MPSLVSPFRWFPQIKILWSKLETQIKSVQLMPPRAHYATCTSSCSRSLPLCTARRLWGGSIDGAEVESEETLFVIGANAAQGKRGGCLSATRYGRAPHGQSVHAEPAPVNRAEAEFLCPPCKKKQTRFWKLHRRWAEIISQMLLSKTEALVCRKYLRGLNDKHRLTSLKGNKRRKAQLYTSGTKTSLSELMLGDNMHEKCTEHRLKEHSHTFLLLLQDLSKF